MQRFKNDFRKIPLSQCSSPAVVAVPVTRQIPAFLVLKTAKNVDRKHHPMIHVSEQGLNHSSAEAFPRLFLPTSFVCKIFCYPHGYQKGRKKPYFRFHCFAVESQAHSGFHLSNVFWIVSVFSLDPGYDLSFKTMKKISQTTTTCILIHT